jgi:hypothetical protein
MLDTTEGLVGELLALEARKAGRLMIGIAGPDRTLRQCRVSGSLAVGVLTRI